MNPEEVLRAFAQLLAPYINAALGNAAGTAQNQPGGFQAQAPNPGSTMGGTTAPQSGQTLGATTGTATTANPFGAPAQTETVTPDMIQSLITPLVQNEQIKAALQAQMQQMGIANLPDVRPDQLPELYKRFSTVKQQAQQAGLIPADNAPAGGASQSII